MNQKKAVTKETMNLDALDIIGASEEWELNCKHKLLNALIESVNTVCRDNNLDYFAIAELLTFAVSEEDTYPKCRYYSIGMLRRDYDIFMDKISERNEEFNVLVHRAIGKDGRFFNRIASISKNQVFSGDYGNKRIRLSLQIFPFDAIPNDENRYLEYIKRIQTAEEVYKSKSKKLERYNSKVRSNALWKIVRKAYKICSFNQTAKDYDNLIREAGQEAVSDKVAVISFNQNPPHRKEEIFPLETVSFLETHISIPTNYEAFASYQNEERKDKVAHAKTEALRRLDLLCEKEKIDYFAAWDLLRTCTHYEGYTDDTAHLRWDVCLPRNDYNRFVELVKKRDDTGLTLLEKERWYSDIPRPVKGILIDEYANTDSEEFNNPICIIPADNLPDNFNDSVRIRREAVAAWKDLVQSVNVEIGKQKGVGKVLDSKRAYENFNEIIQSGQGKCNRMFSMKAPAVITFSYNEIYPLQKKKFGDILINCPNNPHIWTYKEDDMFTEYISEKKTELLAAIDTMCRDNSIVYFAIADLVRAVAVYGDAIPKSNNIPWEIAFIREEYDKFVKKMKESEEEYGIILIEYEDDTEEMPLPIKRVKRKGDRYGRAEIRIRVFDKCPTDFYMKNGFKRMINEKNYIFRELQALKSFYNNRVMPKYNIDIDEDYLKTLSPNEEYIKIVKLAQSFNDTEREYNYKGMEFFETKEISPKDLLPVQRLPFRGIEVNCPRDYTVWQQIQDEALERQIHYIQEADKILLNEFDALCNKIGVGYFVCGGTMLGYMRHQGFIPWDDDIDVAMLRADYDRFMEEAPKYMPERFFLQNRSTDPNIPYLFSKIRLDDTEYITEYNELREFHKGVCLDIFPFDYLPNDKTEREEFIKEVLKLAAIHNETVDNQLMIPEERCEPENDFERECIRVEEDSLSEFWNTSLGDTQAAYLEAATRYNEKAEEEGLTTVGSFVPSYTYINVEDLLPYQRGLFEGIEVSVPKRPDVFLEMQYGNYLELPPKHAQIGHRLLRWKTWEASGGVERQSEE